MVRFLTGVDDGPAVPWPLTRCSSISSPTNRLEQISIIGNPILSEFHDKASAIAAEKGTWIWRCVSYHVSYPTSTYWRIILAVDTFVNPILRNSRKLSLSLTLLKKGNPLGTWRDFSHMIPYMTS